MEKVWERKVNKVSGGRGKGEGRGWKIEVGERERGEAEGKLILAFRLDVDWP